MDVSTVTTNAVVATSPSPSTTAVAKPSPATPSDEHKHHPLLQAALRVASTLHTLLKCHACHCTLPHARPWRSRNCEHMFCASCAAIMRGRPDDKGSGDDGGVAVSAIRRRQGKYGEAGRCLVGGCGVPVCPADVAEDIGVWQIVDACEGLRAWAVSAGMGSGLSPKGLEGCETADGEFGNGVRERDGGVAVTCDRLFENAR